MNAGAPSSFCEGGSWVTLFLATWSLITGRCSLLCVRPGSLFSVNSVLLSLLALSASREGWPLRNSPFFIPWVSLLPVSWSLVAVHFS